MKKYLISLYSVILVFGLVAGVNAATYSYSDMIDYWNWSGTQYGEDRTLSHWWDSVKLTESNPLSYKHNINDDVNFAAGDSVTSANLELDFTNDEYDIVFDGFLSFLSDTTEHIFYAFDGSSWTYLDEVDDGQYTVGVDIALLNIDGMLNVDLAVTNWDNGGTDAWLDHSRLYGTAETGSAATPTPEPSTILLMGAGLLGLMGYSRKRLLKQY